jgi:hypothetical protein
MKSLITCTLPYNYNDQVEENEMGRAFNTHGKDSNAYRVLWEARRKEHPDVGYRIILQEVLGRTNPLPTQKDIRTVR